MIGRLRGKLIHKRPPELLLDVNGVGYELQASMNTIYALNEETDITLFTHLMVRDDAHTLYAFSSEEERDLFRTLLKVNGVGAKMALAILSGMNPSEFQQAIFSGDQTSLVRLPGVGKKTAERLIIELRDRLPKTPSSTQKAEAPKGQQNFLDTSDANAQQREAEAVNALLALGYKPTEASRMVSSVKADHLSTEEIIRQALQSTTKK